MQTNIWLNSDKMFLILTIDLALYTMGFLIAVYLGSPFVEYILSKINLPEKEEDYKKGIKGGGRIIGMMERALVIILIYMNQPTAIAIIFTAKSIMRFEQSKERPFAEYYLIGTLSSITFALIIGIIVNQLVNLVSFSMIH